MALAVEVSGYGICHSQNPYAVLVICVQQESFQAWTVYRRYNSFHELCEQLRSLYPGIPSVPYYDVDNLSADNLEQCRCGMDRWLQTLTANSMILRTQSMYQFLCVDANLPPPYLHLHLRNNRDTSFEDMEMDFMFEKDETEANEQFEDEEEYEDDFSGEEIIQGEEPKTSVFAFGGLQETKMSSNSDKRGPKKYPKTHKQMNGHGKKIGEIADDDGLDIKALSVIEAEFLYNKVDDEDTTGTTMNDGVKSSKPKTINLDSFHIIRVIGKGSFGKVFLVREKASGILYALKVLKKEYIIRKNQVEHTRTERSVLGYVHHPFIVGLNMAFQTSDKLFFVLDYCAGGELFFHLGKVGRFSEERAKFYAAQITLALEYVHSNDVIYRDLKPENVLLDQVGNVRLTDFGLSKEGVSDHSSGANSFCGTPEYIAPEVLQRQGHGRAVDWWSLGALLYEMITGLPPFYSRNRETMFEKIMSADLQFPAFMSENAKDILTRLLVRDPKLRMGSGERDAEELKEHPFFQDLDWEGLLSGRILPPWTPSVVGSLDTSQFDQEFTSMLPTVSPDLRGAYFGSLDGAFEGFTFVDDSAAHMLMANHSAYSGGSSTMMSGSLGGGISHLAGSYKSGASTMPTR